MNHLKTPLIVAFWKQQVEPTREDPYPEPLRLEPKGDFIATAMGEDRTLDGALFQALDQLEEQGLDTLALQSQCIAMEPHLESDARPRWGGFIVYKTQKPRVFEITHGSLEGNPVSYMKVATTFNKGTRKLQTTYSFLTPGATPCYGDVISNFNVSGQEDVLAILKKIPSDFNIPLEGLSIREITHDLQERQNQSL